MAMTAKSKKTVRKNFPMVRVLGDNTISIDGSFIKGFRGNKSENDNSIW